MRFRLVFRAVYAPRREQPLTAGKASCWLVRPSSPALTNSEFDALFDATRPRKLKIREELCHRGDEGTQVYRVIRGTLKLLSTSDGGDDVVFSIVGTGELVAEIGFLGSPTRTAAVSALTESELLAIDRRDFLSFLKAHPEAAFESMAVLAERIKRISELVEDKLFLNLPIRLAKKLVQHASIYGDDVEGGVRINLKLSQEEWGDLVGATRESINKQMRAWNEAGVVSSDAGFVMLERSDVLETLAGCVIS